MPKFQKIPKVFLPPGICFKLLPPLANKSLLLGKTFRLISFMNKKIEEERRVLQGRSSRTRRLQSRTNVRKGQDLRLAQLLGVAEKSATLSGCRCSGLDLLEMHWCIVAGNAAACVAGNQVMRSRWKCSGSSCCKAAVVNSATGTRWKCSKLHPEQWL